MGPFEKERVVIPLEMNVRSLCWDGDELVDWAGGGTRFSLSGQRTDSGVYYAYRFDRAVLSPAGDQAVLYEARGTKGLVVSGTQHCREINRSYYHAGTHEYPIALFRLPDGRQALAHCPDEYNKIEIEELTSGRRLTTRTSEAQDFFHSRLQVSPGGSYLLSAGWVWQPLDAVQVYRVAEVLRNPGQLDQYHELGIPDELFEIHSAAFQSDDVLLLTGDAADTPHPKAHLVGYSLGEQKIHFSTLLEAIPGTIMSAGVDHTVGFYGHPKLFENWSGKVLHEWPELKSGQQNSSIIHHVGNIPPLALDPTRKRFAIADEKQITAIQLA